MTSRTRCIRLVDMRFKEFLDMTSEPVLAFNLLEIFDTRFASSTGWKNVDGVFELVGQVVGFNVRVELAPHMYGGLQGFSAGFETQSEGAWSDTISHIRTENASLIIGAVKAALVEKLNEIEFDYVLFVSKDEVNKRHRIYKTIVQKALHELQVDCGWKEESVHGAKVLALVRRGVDLKLVNVTL